MMSIEDKVNELSIKIKELVKSSPAGELENNLHALLQGAFTKMGLVSREEFDVQAEVLRRTREQLVKLETLVSQLEQDKP